MEFEKKIRAYLQEAEIYQDQALFDEARKRYSQAMAMLKKVPGVKNREKIIGLVTKKINHLNQAYAQFQRIEASAKMSAKERDHVLKEMLFPGKRSTGSAELEWASALLSFGEFERALNEFNKLLIREPALRVTAAKNILKCHTKLSSLDMAKTQFELWVSGDLFTPAQLKQVKVYLQNSIDPVRKEKIIPLSDITILSEEDIEIIEEDMDESISPPSEIDEAIIDEAFSPEKEPEEAIPSPSKIDNTIINDVFTQDQEPGEAVSSVTDEDDALVDEVFGGLKNEPTAPIPEEITIEDDEDVFDEDEESNQILSISIPLPNSVNEIGLEVSYQNGDKIRGIVSKKDSVLLGRLQVGRNLEEVRFYSSYAMFVGACKILKKMRIESGSKKGLYAVYIKVVDPYDGD
jgi:tetratricopeptide (TPR) repeat protein